MRGKILIAFVSIAVMTSVLFAHAQDNDLLAPQMPADQPTGVNTGGGSNLFLGVFFMESYPVAGCEIVKMRPSIIRSTTEFRAPEREEFNNDRNFSKIIHKYQGDLILEAQTIAEKEGYNAIIGSKFFGNTHYQGASNLGSIDGNIGYGLGSITFIGHPVYIVCRN